MPALTSFRLARLVLGIVCAAAVLAAWPAAADEVIFQDNFTLVGNIGREGPIILDPAIKQPTEKGNVPSFFFVDDGARHIIFPGQGEPPVREPGKMAPFDPVQKILRGDVPRPNDLVVLRQALERLREKPINYVGTPEKVGSWDDRWNRVSVFPTDEDNKVSVKQRITLLTPQFARLDADRYRWSAVYYTKELGPDTVRSLLIRHPSLDQKNEKVAGPNSRFQIFRFLLQAGWFDEAERELDMILKDLPNEKEKVESGRQAVKAARADVDFDDLALAFRVGQYSRSRDILARFPWDDASKFAKDDARKYKARLEASDEAIKVARGYLKDLPDRVFPAEHKQVYAAAAATISDDLTADNIDHLETFVKFCRQADRDREEKKTPAQTAGDLLALAVSGWLLGDNVADPNAEAGVRLWKGRQFLLEYLRTANAAARKQMIADYEKGSPLGVDELAQIIGKLPPAAPEEKIGNDLLDLQTPARGSKDKGISYHLRLPPDYSHGKPCPVLFVLSFFGEKPTDALARWADLARKHGYMVVAPEWGGELSHYMYSADEQAAVLDTLRDLRRRFNVDSDRVFMTGIGDGGAMALDVGLSHPDQFAGIIPVNAGPIGFTRAYWSNAGRLPIYLVGGELSGGTTGAVRKQMEAWMGGNFPVIYAEYKGRGAEMFDVEQPAIFDWMDHKVGMWKRANSIPNTGTFASMRTTDNRFYWLSTDGISDASLNDANRWKSKVVGATIKGRIDDGNQIRLSVEHFKNVTICFAPNMIDFKKPVTVTIGTRTPVKDKVVKPSLQTLLDELYETGDRQRLVVAKLEVPL
jgi:pimeloyl-ACP methyl ester carboxylesterase